MKNVNTPEKSFLWKVWVGVMVILLFCHVQLDYDPVDLSWIGKTCLVLEVIAILFVGSVGLWTILGWVIN